MAGGMVKMARGFSEGSSPFGTQHSLFVPDLRAAPGSGLLLQLGRCVMVRLSWPRHAAIAVLLRYE
jgi:hypothetical protein